MPSAEQIQQSIASGTDETDGATDDRTYHGPTGTTHAGQELADIVSRLRRAMRRAARAADPAMTLPVAQLELLSCIAESPGVRPSELARMLRLAPSSVATLLGTLQSAGHVTRTGGTADRRTACLHLSATGTAQVTRWQQVNEQIIGAALQTLPQRGQAALQQAAPALRDLTTAIDSLADLLWGVQTIFSGGYKPTPPDPPPAGVPADSVTRPGGPLGLRVQATAKLAGARRGACGSMPLGVAAVSSPGPGSRPSPLSGLRCPDRAGCQVVLEPDAG